MTTFDDRERAFESKFALDQEQEFRAAVRRDRLVGLWAGQLLGKSGAELDAYAAELVRRELQSNADAHVFDQVSKDLEGQVTPDEVRAKMDEMLHQARREVAEGVQAGGSAG